MVRTVVWFVLAAASGAGVSVLMKATSGEIVAVTLIFGIVGAAIGGVKTAEKKLGARRVVSR